MMTILKFLLHDIEKDLSRGGKICPGLYYIDFNWPVYVSSRRGHTHTHVVYMASES
jgi:hypothetical protein